MSQEIELKLTLPVRAAPRLRAHPLLGTQKPRRKYVRNIYYDTPEQTLRQQRIALRHRLIGEQWLITVKTSSLPQDGLSRRNEWEKPCEAGEFTFAHVDDPELRALLDCQRDHLQEAFRTDFYRSAWLLEDGPNRAELVLDLGYIRAHGQRQQIHEVEIELLQGEEDFLQRIAAELRRELPLQPFMPSKASRGYTLMQHTGRKNPVT
jgi:triphosphatase